MSATSECTLTVGIGDLQRAIASVVCHAEKAKPGDEQPILCRVRVTAGKEYLTIAAADGRTSGLAWVRIIADDRKGKWSKGDGPFIVDLYPKQARQIAAAMTPIRDEGNDYGDASLHLTLDDVTITDLSGKYPDTSTTVPTIEQEATMTLDGTEQHGYPDLLKVIGSSFSRAAGTFKPMQPPPGAGSRFEVAAREYSARLVYEPVGDAADRAWLVWLRDAPFAGMFVQPFEDDEDIRRRASERLTHLRRLGLLTAEDEARLQLGGDVDQPPATEERFTEDEAEQLLDEARTAAEDADGFYDADKDPDAAQDEQG